MKINQTSPIRNVIKKTLKFTKGSPGWKPFELFMPINMGVVKSAKITDLPLSIG